MADDDIDVVGEFDLKTGLSEEFYDTNELPSKSANLLPEFTSPAWMLEQGWSLDSCIDEKSKATIEKMLLEEQQYLCGRKTSRYLSFKNNVLLVPAGSSKVTTPNRSPWTQEEKNTFLQGLGIFGRSWSKIASLIPTRTSLQVKNYAQQYMKNLAKKKAEVDKIEQETLKSMSDSSLFIDESSSVAATLASVTTGQPTVTSVATKKLNGKLDRNNVKKSKPGKKLMSSSRKVNDKISKVKKSIFSDNMSVLENSDVIVISRKSHTKSSLSSYNSSSPDGITIANGISDISSSSFSKETELSEDEVVVDIENDDDENVILQSRSASPSCVYEQLLKSSQVSGENIDEDTSKLQLVENMKQPKEENIESKISDSKLPDSTNGSPRTEEDNSSHDTISKSDSLSDDSSKDRIYEVEDDDLQNRSETNANGLLTSSGDFVALDAPTEEKILAPDFISEEEKQIHADFFDGRPSKTPERYLKIRSYIIDCWLKSKPNYLNKTCIRPGLKNCGDVNCIGRIHCYLECIGAINFGCKQSHHAPHKPLLGAASRGKVKGFSRDIISTSPQKSESTRVRKRRIRNDSGLWVDEKELEGKTIDHNIEKSEKKPKQQKPTKVMYDPFKLVPCLKFSDETPAPYKIEILSTALAVMDIHAHISKTEVIGMLGGQFSSGLLTISMAVPCKSMSTGMQCEMDPVSQTLASDQIENVGLSVVGWYHSHPSFAPDPSVRDIETQQKFQYWFSKEGNHFVGVIISPYNTTSTDISSEISCLTISDTHSKDYTCNLPYKFDYGIVHSNNPADLLSPAKELAEKYSTYVNRVRLSCLYKSSMGITCLSKMLQSVRRFIDQNNEAHLTDSASMSKLLHKSEVDEVIQCLENMFGQLFDSSQ